MKNSFLLLFALALTTISIPAFCQVNDTIEYIQLLKKPMLPPDTINITNTQLIQIMKGDSIFLLLIKNAPNGFNKLGEIKKNKKLSKKYGMVVFDLTGYIIDFYSDFRSPALIIEGPDGNRIKINNSQKKQRIENWDDD